MMPACAASFLLAWAGRHFVLVLIGRGGPQTFVIGLDQPMTDFGKLARVMRDLSVPVIGRINGDCVAGGMGLMALCDLAVVADHARFGLPEARVGVFPMQVLVFLRNMIGARHVNELCLTGELIDAARAREIGIANYVVPFEELDSRVATLIARLAEMSPVALRRGKYAIAAMERMAFPEALAFAETLISVTALTRDASEELAAFNERTNRSGRETLQWLKSLCGSAAHPARGAIVRERSISCLAPTSTFL